jgi:hypothetical protein
MGSARSIGRSRVQAPDNNMNNGEQGQEVDPFADVQEEAKQNPLDSSDCSVHWSMLNGSRKPSVLVRQRDHSPSEMSVSGGAL